MTQAASPKAVVVVLDAKAVDARALVRAETANELVFAVVGHVGSGTSTVASALKTVLETAVGGARGFDVTILKARDEIEAWAEASGEKQSDGQTDTLEYVGRLQDLGDKMRLADRASVARALVKTIRTTRRGKMGIDENSDEQVLPDGAPRAYILDSLRHPAEVHLLRAVYRSAFTLVGVVCDEDIRVKRLNRKYRDAGEKNARLFMERDEQSPEPYGQRVSDTFHLADVFLDNSASRYEDEKQEKPSEDWNIIEQLSRLVKIMTHREVVRPTSAETAMHAAYGAQMRSACLSRQVGAAVMDVNGNIVSTGTNEVPTAGGGVYGEGFEDAKRQVDELPVRDHRCAITKRYCSNTTEQNGLIEKVVEALKGAEGVKIADATEVVKALKKSPIKGLLEFSRAVHAEMDALLRAARKGTSPVGARVFVTTFPCHYCARHLVAAGVDEVQYIEPYPKSKALGLHDDSITVQPKNWVAPSNGGDKVLFRPFTGVAPRLYSHAFLKDRELKNTNSGLMEFGEPEWGTVWDLTRVSYIQIEETLSKDERAK